MKSYKREKAVYRFQNTGTTDIHISGVKSNCSCNIIEHSKKAIRPGESGEITVEMLLGGTYGEQTGDVYVEFSTNKGKIINKTILNVTGWSDDYLGISSENISMEIEKEAPTKSHAWYMWAFADRNSSLDRIPEISKVNVEVYGELKGIVRIEKNKVHLPDLIKHVLPGIKDEDIRRSEGNSWKIDIIADSSDVDPGTYEGILNIAVSSDGSETFSIPIQLVVLEKHIYKIDPYGFYFTMHSITPQSVIISRNDKNKFETQSSNLEIQYNRDLFAFDAAVNDKGEIVVSGNPITAKKRNVGMYSIHCIYHLNERTSLRISIPILLR